MQINDFTRDITAEADAGLIEKPIGRDQELSTILSAIIQEGKSNVLITGPAGCGKTVLVEGIAYMISQSEVPKGYPKDRVVELNITAMNSGAMYVGQFEKRVSVFFSYLEKNPNTVVFIDEIHMIMGFGKTSDSGASRDFSQIIKPKLASGDICCIGATTEHEYKTYIASDSAFVRRFNKLNLQTLSPEVVFQILRRAAVKLKYKTGLDYDDSSLKAIINASEKLLPDRHQPDKSLDILKRISTVLSNERSGGFYSEGKNFSEYIALLEKEIRLLKKDDFSSLRNLATSWLGVERSKKRKISINEDQILQQIANGE